MTWDLLVLKGLLDLRGLKVIKAFKEKLVRRGHRVRKERKAIKGFKESKVSKVYRERLVQPGQME